MKIFRAIAAVAFLAAISAASINAQTKPATPATTTTTPQTAATLPEAKIALVNTEVFLDEKSGIARLIAAAKRVESEFQPRRTELQTLQQQIEKATADLQKAAPVQDQKVTAQQQERIDQMKKDYQRKGEDAQAAYQKRIQEILGPVYEAIDKALGDYAKARGITLIIDVTKMQGILSASSSTDITQSFISEFNSKNPSTAALTPPE